VLPEIERLKVLSGSTGLKPEMLEEYKEGYKRIWSELVRPD
jgi:L-rhamnose mutarotase